MEPWQESPFAPIVLRVWSVAQRDPLRLGRPEGTLCLLFDSADDDVETLS